MGDLGGKGQWELLNRGLRGTALALPRRMREASSETGALRKTDKHWSSSVYSPLQHLLCCVTQETGQDGLQSELVNGNPYVLTIGPSLKQLQMAFPLWLVQ